MRRLGDALAAGLILLALLVLLFPVAWLIGTSFKAPVEYGAYPPTLVPLRPTLESYRNAFTRFDAEVYLRNTVIVAVSSTAVACALGTLGAYSLVRFRYPGRGLIAFVILALRMFPVVVIAIPLFTILKALGLLNTYWALVLAYQLFLVPFVVWMMKGFFEELPAELEEAALVDGCSRLGAFARIALPLSAPGLAATATFCLLLSWNEFLAPLLFTQSRAVQPVSLLFANFIDPGRGIQWGELAALGTIGILPILLLAFLLQRYLVRGLSLGAVKG
jgi:multiple sugar transport system permease protein